MKKILVAGALAGSLFLAGCGTTDQPSTAQPSQGSIAFAEETPDPEALGGAENIDSPGSPEGGFGETLKDHNGIEVTVTYKGFEDPGESAYPSGDPAPVFEVAVKNGSEKTVDSQGVNVVASYGNDTVTEAELVCGAGSFNCKQTPALKPGKSTAAKFGFQIPVGTPVHLEILVWFDDSLGQPAEFSVDGTAD